LKQPRFRDESQALSEAEIKWWRSNDFSSVFIDPCSPWQKAWIESFNGWLRDELLNA
jgi:putative transposase